MSKGKAKRSAKIGLVTTTLLSLLIFNSCGSHDPDPAPTSTSTATSTTYPNGLAVTSLTAASSSSFLPEGFDEFDIHMAASTATISSSQSFQEKKAVLDAIAVATAATTCEVTLPNITSDVTDPTCYGPALDYVFHLDFLAGPNESGQLPTGDLGIWSATESDGTACAAAKLNKENEKIAIQMDLALLLVSSTSCLIKTNSALSVPAVGATLTYTEQLNAAISVNNSTTTVSSATLERLSDHNSNPLYQYTIVLTQNSTTVTLNVKHSPTNSTNTTYLGKIWGKFVGGMPGVATSRATSLLYERTSSNLNYKMLSVSYDGSSISNPFTTNGDVDPTINWSGNFSQTLINQNTTSGLGLASYAWQAGRNDDSTRVFNVFTTTSGSNTVGHGFFGYGTKFNPTTGELSTNLITKFICNWAGPNNNHTGVSGKAQKQSFILTGGKFVPDSSVGDPNLINYAPVNSCDMTAGETRGGAGGAFKYKLTTDSYPGTQPAVSNELIATSSDTNYTYFLSNAPAAPTDFN